MIKVNLIKKFKYRFLKYISNIVNNNNKLRSDQNLNLIISQFLRNSDILKNNLVYDYSSITT